jgi:uncharacterized protein (TIGR02611 family)
MAGPVRAVRRAVVTVVGVAVLVAGLLMLVLPGPGLLTVAASLAILSTEYDWARRHVTRVRRRASQVSQIAGASPRNTAFAVTFGLGLLAVGTGTLREPDWVPVVGDLAVGIGLILGGAAVVLGTIMGYRERRRILRGQVGDPRPR